MPVGAGVIVSGNPNIYNTEVIINSITPDPAYCGDSLTIDVTVNNLDGVSTPTGDIEIVDLNTGVTVASGTLAIGTATLISGSLTGIQNLVAKYLGQTADKTHAEIIKYWRSVDALSIREKITKQAEYMAETKKRDIVA